MAADLKETLRSHHDIQNSKNVAQRRKVERHYAQLAERASSQGYAIDLVCCSLEQTGLWEMQTCVQRSGGQVLQAETFGAPHLRSSLARLLQKDGQGELQMGYATTVELRTSRECSGVQVLCAGASEQRTQAVDQSEVADARCFSWAAGAVGPHSCGALVLSRGKESTPSSGGGHLIQLCACFTHASGRRRQRITTLRLPRLTRPLPMREMLPAVDQQAVAAILTRVAVGKAEEGASPQEVRPGAAHGGRCAPHK